MAIAEPAPAGESRGQLSDWRVSLTGEDGRRFAAPAVVVNETVTGSSALRALLQLGERVGLEGPLREATRDYREIAQFLPYEEREFYGGAVPGRDAISEWADQAVDLWNGLEPSQRPERSGPGLVWMQGSRQTAAAWHDESLLVFYLPPGVRRFEINYRESAAARDMRRRMLREWPGPLRDRVRASWNAESAVEWTAYCGENTTRESGEGRVRRGWKKTFGVDHDGRVGVVRVYVYQKLVASKSRGGPDPTYRARIKHWRGQLGPLADEHPEVSEVPDGSLTDAVVFIHGTLACGLANLESLIQQLPASASPRRILRFEHDTFLNIDKNAEHLANILNRKLSTAHQGVVVLIAHSRGGLVARATAGLLRNKGLRPEQIRIATFGTPHQGTPLVNAADRLLAGLASAPTLGLSRINSALEPATQLIKYLHKYGEPPEGILAMAPGSQVLGILNILPVDYQFLAYGATYLKGDNPQSRGVAFLDKHGRNLFIENRRIQRNDLVVSVDSATSVGKGAEIAEACGHFGYFDQPEVGDAIAHLLVPPSPPPTL